MESGPIQVLSNLHLPAVEGYRIRAIGDLLPDPAEARAWNPKKERRSLSAILAEAPAAWRPDILVCASPEYLPIPSDVASFKGIKILLITDWNVCLRFLPDLGPLFDLCFVDWEGFRLLRRAGMANVFHQPLFGHDPLVFRDLGRRRDLELSFCGNQNPALHPDRNRLLYQVAKWGRGRPIHLRQSFGDEYVDVLNRSRTVFNYSIRSEANMRLFESMACGAVPLVEEGNQEVSLFLREGEHFLSYPRDRPGRRLDAILADAGRLEAIAAAARAEAAKHTKMAQLKTLLDFSTGRGPSFSDTLPAPSGRAPGAGELRAGRKALAKLRLLGSNFSLEEALSEAKAAAAEFPELEAETVPAILMTGIEAVPGLYRGAVKAVMERNDVNPAVPPAIRGLVRTQLSAILGLHGEVVAWGDRCLRALDDPGGLPDGAGPYGFFLWPSEIGRGFNSDFNRACKDDLPSRSSRALRNLLAAHCRQLMARSLLALGRPAESLAAAEAIPENRFASLERRESLVAACLETGDAERARVLLREWFAERPLDVEVWKKVIRALKRIGDAEGLADLEREMILLAGALRLPQDAENILASIKAS